MNTELETIGENEPMVVTRCRKCGAEIEYEPVMIFGRDLAAALHVECEPCRDAARERALAAEVAAATERTRAALRALLPPDLLDTDPRHPEFNAPLWKVARGWWPAPAETSLGLIGPAARCKTRVMALLAKRVAHRGIRIAWTSAVHLRDAAADRNSRHPGISAVAREHLADCLNAPWLFLDDLGKNEWTPSFESQLFQILDHRMGHRLPVVWSANDHPETFAPRISGLNASPIIGRLLDRTTVMDLR